MLKNIYIIFIYIILMIFFFIFSCKTITDPIIYNKSTTTIKKELDIIQILINNGNFEKAEFELEKNLKLYPDNQDIMELKAWLYIKENKLEDSEKIFLYLIEKKNNNPLCYAGLARIYRIRGDKANALKYINIGISYLPTLSFLWLEKGILEYEDKEYKKALVNFNKAYTLDSNNIEAYFFKYLTMLLLGRELDDIKQYWEKIIQSKAAKSWYFLYHADVLFKLNHKDYAYEIVRDGIYNYPDDPYLLNSYSYFEYLIFSEKNDQNILNDAKEKIMKCIDISKKLEPEFIDTYLIILEALGEKETLEKAANKYFLLFPNSEVIIKWIKKLNIN